MNVAIWSTIIHTCAFTGFDTKRNSYGYVGTGSPFLNYNNKMPAIYVFRRQEARLFSYDRMVNEDVIFI